MSHEVASVGMDGLNIWVVCRCGWNSLTIPSERHAEAANKALREMLVDFQAHAASEREVDAD